jgi:hypothetical protein
MKYLWITTSIITGALLFAGCDSTDKEIEKKFTEQDDGSSVNSPYKMVDAHNLGGYKISAHYKTSIIDTRLSIEFKCDGSFREVTRVSTLGTQEDTSVSGDEIDFSGPEENRRMNWKGKNDHDDTKQSDYITLDKADRIVIGTSYINILKVNMIEQTFDCTKL